MTTPNQELDERTEEIEIDLRYYFYLLRAHWLIIIATAVLAGLVALTASLLMEPVYRSTATIYVNSRQGEGSADFTDLRASESLARTYAELITSRAILEKTQTELSLIGQDVGLGEIRSGISASPVANTQLIRIQVENNNPQLAADIANTASQMLINEIEEIETEDYTISEANLSEQIAYLDAQIAESEAAIEAIQDSETVSDIAERNRLESLLVEYNRDYSPLLQKREDIRLEKFRASSNMRIFEQATAASNPIQPRIPLNTIAGVLLGLVGAIAFVFGREILDDTIRNPEEVSQRYSVPILGQVLNFDAENEKLITLLQPRSPIAEAFRSLRLNLKYASVDNELRSILVTSAAPGEGKSTLAANLGVVLAQGEQDVVIIDGDLRRPKVHKNFELSNRDGLSGLFLESLDTLPDVVQATSIPRLSAISSGALPPNPSELLDSDKARQIVNKATESADVVIIDAPPIIAMTDAAALSQYVDGVILVIRAGSTRRSAVEQALQRLQYVGANILGFAITDIDNVFQKGGYYYYQYYQEYYKAYSTYYDENDKSDKTPPPKPTRLKRPASGERKGSLARLTSLFKL